MAYNRTQFGIEIMPGASEHNNSFLQQTSFSVDIDDLLPITFNKTKQ